MSSEYLMRPGRKPEEDEALTVRAEALRQEAREFAMAAFEAGHYPNPVMHHVDGCVICAAAMNVRESKLPLDEDGLWPC